MGCRAGDEGKSQTPCAFQQLTFLLPGSRWSNQLEPEPMRIGLLQFGRQDKIVHEKMQPLSQVLQQSAQIGLRSTQVQAAQDATEIAIASSILTQGHGTNSGRLQAGTVDRADTALVRQVRERSRTIEVVRISQGNRGITELPRTVQ